MIIDAHCHFAGDTPEALAILDERDVKALNICVAADGTGQWREQASVYSQLADRFPRRFAWCTSFDPPGCDDADYVGRVIQQLGGDFANGAVACKVWRNIGMEVRSASADFVMVDDPLFEPIFAYVEQAERTLIMHIGEPQACWLPLDDANPLREVLAQHPELHRYRQAGLPSHENLMAARDRVIGRHPSLKVVGAHAGSLEHSVVEIARRLDRFPNFAIDTSARIYGLSLLDPADLREFFVTYQDRVLFGTDADFERPQSSMPPAERERSLDAVRDLYRVGLAYFGSRDTIRLRDRSVQGLGLPDAVLAKVFCENAREWVPGL